MFWKSMAKQRLLIVQNGLRIITVLFFPTCIFFLGAWEERHGVSLDPAYALYAFITTILFGLSSVLLRSRDGYKLVIIELILPTAGFIMSFLLLGFILIIFTGMPDQ
jgi:hypothetical protein